MNTYFVTINCKNYPTETKLYKIKAESLAGVFKKIDDMILHPEMVNSICVYTYNVLISEPEEIDESTRISRQEEET